MTFVMSMQDIGTRADTFIGFENYRTMLHDPALAKGLWVTMRFVLVIVPASTILPLIIGILASYMSSSGQFIIKSAMYLPTLTAGVIIATVWRWIFHPNSGILNYLLGTQIAWLGQNPFAFYAISIMIIAEGMGMPVIMFLAVFVSVDETLQDAAKIDGCGRVRTAWYVTIPEAIPMIAFVTITKTIGILQIWIYPYLLTGGGPNAGTTPLTLMIYQEGILYGRYGYASALGVLLLAITLIFSVAQKMVIRNR